VLAGTRVLVNCPTKEVLKLCQPLNTMPMQNFGVHNILTYAKNGFGVFSLHSYVTSFGVFSHTYVIFSLHTYVTSFGVFSHTYVIGFGVLLFRYFFSVSFLSVVTTGGPLLVPLVIWWGSLLWLWINGEEHQLCSRTGPGRSPYYWTEWCFTLPGSTKFVDGNRPIPS
jgi:hypothetical protein